MSESVGRDQLLELQERGRLLLSAGRAREATGVLKQSLRVARQLNRQTFSAQSSEDLLDSLRLMASVSGERERPDAQVDYLEKAVRIAESLTRGQVATALRRRTFALVSSELGDAYAAVGAADAAIEQHRRAVAQFRALHERHGQAQTGEDLANALEQLADVLSSTGRGTGIRPLLERALELRRVNVPHVDGVPFDWRPLVAVLGKLGREVQLRDGRRTNVFFAEIETLLRKQLAADPSGNDVFARVALAQHLYQQGFHERGSKRLKEAHALLSHVRSTFVLPPRDQNLFDVLEKDLRAHAYGSTRDATEATRGAQPSVSLQSLYDAVYESPGDESRRLVLADALSEAGDPRGEFIALQCAPFSRESQTRQRQLLRSHAREWLEALGPIVLPPAGAQELVTRGFPSSVALRDEASREVFARTKAWATIEHLRVSRFRYHANLSSLKTLSGVDDAGEVRIPALQSVLATQRCLDGDAPFTAVDELGCVSSLEAAEWLELLQAVNERSWFKSVSALVVLDQRLGFAFEVLERIKSVREVRFRSALRREWLPLIWVPTWSFELTRDAALTMTLDGTLNEHSIREFFNAPPPTRLVLRRGPAMAMKTFGQARKLIAELPVLKKVPVIISA